MIAHIEPGATAFIGETDGGRGPFTPTFHHLRPVNSIPQLMLLFSPPPYICRLPLETDHPLQISTADAKHALFFQVQIKDQLPDRILDTFHQIRTDVSRVPGDPK